MSAVQRRSLRPLSNLRQGSCSKRNFRSNDRLFLRFSKELAVVLILGQGEDEPATPDQPAAEQEEPEGKPPITAAPKERLRPAP